MRCLLPTRRSFRRRAWTWSRRAPCRFQTARDLGISESCLRNWMNRRRDRLGRKAGVTSDEQQGARGASSPDRNAGDARRRSDPQASLVGVLRSGRTCSNLGVPAGPGARRGRDPCRGGLRVLEHLTIGVLRLGQRPRFPQSTELADAAVGAGAVAVKRQMTTTIRRIHADSRETYGQPRRCSRSCGSAIRGVHIGRKRVARLTATGRSRGRFASSEAVTAGSPTPHATDDLVTSGSAVPAYATRNGSGSATSRSTARETAGVYCAAVIVDPFRAARDRGVVDPTDRITRGDRRLRRARDVPLATPPETPDPVVPQTEDRGQYTGALRASAAPEPGSSARWQESRRRGLDRAPSTRSGDEAPRAPGLRTTWDSKTQLASASVPQWT